MKVNDIVLCEDIDRIGTIIGIDDNTHEAIIQMWSLTKDDWLKTSRVDKAARIRYPISLISKIGTEIDISKSLNDVLRDGLMLANRRL